MNMMFSWIVTWLSVNLSLPAIYEHPQIEYVSHERILAVSISAQPVDSAMKAAYMPPGRSRRNIEAVYDDSSRTIYLDQNWTGLTPAEMSVLVHEMVHHLQNVAGLKYECEQAREEVAYIAQDKWLTLFGRNLMKEFRFDPMTMLVRTKCIH
jgi:hypothetical protein